MKHVSFEKLVLMLGFVLSGLVACGPSGFSVSSAGDQKTFATAQTLNSVLPAFKAAGTSTSPLSSMFASAATSSTSAAPSSHGSRSSQGSSTLSSLSTSSSSSAPPVPAATPTPVSLPDLSQIEAQIISSIDANAAEIKSDVGGNSASVIAQLQASVAELQSIESSASSAQEQQFVEMGIAVLNELIKVLN